MLYWLIPSQYASLITFVGILSTFAVTVLALNKLSCYLPKDHGRAFAVEGQKSVGKPQGAGIIFIWVFVFAVLLFAPFHAETVIYLVLLLICMMTGYLDDASDVPWGQLKKGILDLCVAVLAAITFLRFNPNEIELAFLDFSFTLPPVLYACGIIVLVWVSVNVTNCADGVDGLSGTLAIITIMSIYAVDRLKGKSGDFSFLFLLFCVCILGYLWFNATPSKLLMGDAGSRAIGLFISIGILKTGYPFLYIPLALVLILDGGLGLLKLVLLRISRHRFHAFDNIHFPLHDHVRKQLGWSNTQTVFRYAIIQILLSAAVILAMQI